MISFPQNVTLLHPEPPSCGSVHFTSTGTAARIVRETDEFADDRHGVKNRITLLMPPTASPHSGDRILFADREYEITGVRRCRDVEGENLVFRVEAIY